MTPLRLYRYVGPQEIRTRALTSPERSCISGIADARQWLARAEPIARHSYVPATYIVDSEQRLWIADRRSEHVACAGGGEVLAAGELVFSDDGKRVEVIEASNQSTGYCPEPDCWSVLSAVLDRLQIPRPQQFTASFEFRRCDGCGATNLIKDGVFECAVCSAALSTAWNFD